MHVVLALTMGPAFVYGLLNICAPGLTTRWQVNATRKRSEDDPRRAVGTAFAGLVGSNESEDPSHDRRVRRRVRLIGLTEVVLSATLAVVFWSRAG